MFAGGGFVNVENHGGQTAEAVLDPEALVFHPHRFPHSVDFIHLDAWTRTVADAIAGRDYDF